MIPTLLLHLHLVLFRLVHPVQNLHLDCNPAVVKMSSLEAHLQSSVFKLSKDLIDSIHEEGIVAYTS